MTTCPVCYDPYTATTRKPIPCPDCAYAACTRCVKSFLLSAPSDPHCMNCSRAWIRPFLDAHLPPTWLDGDYIAHRGRTLLDRERALLPASQAAAEIEAKKRIYGTELEDLLARRALIDAEVERRQWFIRNGWEPPLDYFQQKEYRVRPGADVERLIQLGIHPNSKHLSIPEEAEAAWVAIGWKKTQAVERRAFIAACPDSECRGFLSTAYKCGTCSKQFCSACREHKADDGTHTCDPAVAATMAALAKDTRGCPRCGTGITKISGCDQMYCTLCDTAFSWTTGKIATGVIHNPHYYERLKALTGSVPRQPGDTVCGGWPQVHALRLGDHGQSTLLRGLYQSARHVEIEVLPNMPQESRAIDNEDLRVRYLLKDIDERRFQQLLRQREKTRQRNLEIRGPLELFVLTVLEFMVERARTKEPPTADQILALQAQIRTLVNEPLVAIGRRYGCRVPQINLMVEIGKGHGYRPYEAAVRVTAAKKGATEEESSEE